MSDTTCKECGEPCTVTAVDFGIGPYEYWGSVGYDSRVSLVSACCEADFDGEAPEEEPEEPDYDIEDYDY